VVVSYGVLVVTPFPAGTQLVPVLATKLPDAPTKHFDAAPVVFYGHSLTQIPVPKIATGKLPPDSPASKLVI